MFESLNMSGFMAVNVLKRLKFKRFIFLNVFGLTLIGLDIDIDIDIDRHRKR